MAAAVTLQGEADVLYGVLGVGEGASPGELARAYRQKARETHPDKPNGSEAAFRRVQEAYDTLGNEEKRKAYDARRKAMEAREEQGQHAVVLDVVAIEECTHVAGTVYEHPCNCGGLFRIDAAELEESEETNVACDGCTYILAVTRE